MESETVFKNLATSAKKDEAARFIDIAISTAEKAIGHLAEYRRALITSAVTGKINVRHYRHSSESQHPVTEVDYA